MEKVGGVGAGWGRFVCELMSVQQSGRGLPWSFCLFCKQKTAYEMRISDWSSDVCSSDLLFRGMSPELQKQLKAVRLYTGLIVNRLDGRDHTRKIGRATCRESGCPYV